MPATRGAARTVGANTPFFLDEPGRAWLVESGEILLFAVPVRDGLIAGARRYLGSVAPGEAMLGMHVAIEGAPWSILATGLADTVIRELDPQAVQAMVADVETLPLVVEMVERWTMTVTAGLIESSEADRGRKLDTLLEVDTSVRLETGMRARARRGVLWARVSEGAVVAPSGLRLGAGDDIIPLTEAMALEATAVGATLEVVSTEHALVAREVRGALVTLGRILATAWHEGARDQAQRDATRIAKARANDDVIARAAEDELASVLADKSVARANAVRFTDPLLAACTIVGNELGIAIRKPVGGGPSSALREIAAASRVRTRRVELARGWQHEENGPLLGTLRAESRPVALLPTSDGRGYVVVDPADGSRRPVSDLVAAEIDPAADLIYRSFASTALSAWDVFAFGLRGSRDSIVTLILLGLVGGALATTIPLGTGLLFGTIIPAFQTGALVQIALLLIVAAVAAALFDVVRGMAVLRIQTRFDASTQAAVWDRLLSLPASFFRTYATGDLASRAMGIDAIRGIMTGVTVSAILGSIFSLFSLALLFAYSARLALIGVALALVTLLITLITTFSALGKQRALLAQQGKISGLVLQFLTGISKLRVAGAELRAFAVWAADFAQQRRITYAVQRLSIVNTVFNAAWPAITTTAIFASVVLIEHGAILSGTYVAFTAAFSQFLAATLAMSGALGAVMQAIPIFERAKPIFETSPEVVEGQIQPPSLSGKVEVNAVTFRYNADGPPTLDDVTIHANPGEFVAIVGPSGSGKSTIFRMLLGFERPEQGSVAYDDRDLRGLDVASIRRQIGVVLQEARLMPGSVQQNILGSADLGVEDAWEAAALVGLDAEIKEMPMQMNTHVSEGGGAFSGGQRQRLIIARAVVKRPRLVILDEATSALDNATQSTVATSLERMNATRIVIAHRLSTIVKADRIYVLVGGKVVQVGTYEELVAVDGAFAELAKRQML